MERTARGGKDGDNLCEALEEAEDAGSWAQGKRRVIHKVGHGEGEGKGRGRDGKVGVGKGWDGDTGGGGEDKRVVVTR